ncbi:iron ABC transporter substrate-binding protein [Xanthobacter autotrophicus]|uniref:iron ABC transporter substrate-binding protein n=1 Tax=Xanthobacter autotrophicus TaxID=280 RepID=UPI003729A58C
MTASTTAGAKIYIGTTLAIDFATDAGAIDDFEGDTFTEIKEVEDLGEFGDESSEVEFTAIGDTRKRRYKGTRDAGVIALVCGRDPLDPGQKKVLDAEKVKDAYNFKVVVNDAPVGGTPSTYYFRALVMSAKNSFGSVDNIVKVNFSLAINTAILEVVAAVTP